MIKLFRLFVILLLVNVYGCATTGAGASGIYLISRYDYSQAAPKLKFIPHAYLLVADLRPEVVSIHKPLSYVGSSFSVLDSPLDVVNADGCTAMHTTHTSEKCLPFSESVRNAILRQGGDTTSGDRLYVIINQWKTEMNNGLKLSYDLAAIVEDKEKRVVAKSHILATDESINTDGIGSVNYRNHLQAATSMGKIVSGVLARKLEELLGGNIAKALQRTE